MGGRSRDTVETGALVPGGLPGGLTNSGSSSPFIPMGEPIFSRPGVLGELKWVMEGS